VRRLATIAGLVGLLTLGNQAWAEQLTVALSTPEIRIGSNFSGVPVTVFGVIEPDAQSASHVGKYEIATLVLGPPESVVARRKDRILGVWANSASEIFLGAPSFYAADSTGEIADLADAEILKRMRLGFDNIGFTYRDRVGRDNPGAAEFREAFLRIKVKEGLYTEQAGGVGMIGKSIFRTTVWIPANAPIGFYQVSVFLLADGELIARAGDSFTIAKTGSEQFLFNFSRNEAFIYGVVCVAMALFIGWLAGVIFRRD